MSDLLQDTITKRETVKADLNQNVIFENNTFQVITILTETTQGHNTGTDEASMGAAHNNHTTHIEAKAINLTVTCCINHIANHPHIEVLQLTNPEIAVGHAHDHPTDLKGRTHMDQVHIPASNEENHTLRGP